MLYSRPEFTYVVEYMGRTTQGVLVTHFRKNRKNVGVLYGFAIESVRNLAYLDSSSTSIPEIVALFEMGSKVRFSLPCGVGLK